MVLKRTPADAAFSDCVRERAGWRCEICGTQYHRKSRGLHCSHFISRGNWGVRFDPLNAEALCYAHHMSHGGGGRIAETLTDAQQTTLFERRNDSSLGKAYRRTKGKGAIAKHYRAEYERMQKEGATSFKRYAPL
jgi:hypothetical protein